MPKQTKTSLERYMKRDVSWLAKKLFEAREEDERLYTIITELRDDNSRLKSANDCLAALNSNMGEVLKDRGLMPIQIIVNYRIQNCDHCPNFIDNDCLECWPDIEDDWCSEVCKIKNAAVFKGFWTWDINDNSMFEGIASNFEKFRCKAESITTMDGRILWKSSEEGGSKKK